MSEITLKLKTPMVPNFIIIEMPAGKRQDGFMESPKVSVGDLTDDQLESVAKEWKKELYAVAKRQRLTKRAQ